MLTMIFDCAFNEHNLDSDTTHICELYKTVNLIYLFIARLDDH